MDLLAQAAAMSKCRPPVQHQNFMSRWKPNWSCNSHVQIAGAKVQNHHEPSEQWAIDPGPQTSRTYWPGSSTIIHCSSILQCSPSCLWKKILKMAFRIQSFLAFKIDHLGQVLDLDWFWCYFSIFLEYSSWFWSSWHQLVVILIGEHRDLPMWSAAISSCCK